MKAARTANAATRNVSAKAVKYERNSRRSSARGLALVSGAEVGKPIPDAIDALNRVAGPADGANLLSDIGHVCLDRVVSHVVVERRHLIAQHRSAEYPHRAAHERLQDR